MTPWSKLRRRNVFCVKAMIRTVRATITGVVQGVGYRAFVERQAVMRGLSGWVRNRRDGSVEAVFAGDAAAVDAMLAACHKGPRMAMVEEVAVENVPALEEPRGFQVLPTQ
jgi:acylphosphatase